MNAAVEQALALCSVCMGVKLPPPSVKETHRPAALYASMHPVNQKTGREQGFLLKICKTQTVFAISCAFPKVQSL